MMHEPLKLFDTEAVEDLNIARRAESANIKHLGLPRVNRAEPCVRGKTVTSQLMGRISLGLRPSGRSDSCRIIRRRVFLSTFS